MSLLISNIITAAVVITKMSEDTKDILLLDILENHPGIMIKAMKKENITFDEPAAKAPKVVKNVVDNKCYKVVVHNPPMSNKVNLIKMFCEITGAGLAEAKNWTEGTSYLGYPAGVFAKDLPKNEAENILHLLNKNNTVGFKFEILEDNAHYMYNPIHYRS